MVSYYTSGERVNDIWGFQFSSRILNMSLCFHFGHIIRTKLVQSNGHRNFRVILFASMWAWSEPIAPCPLGSEHLYLPAVQRSKGRYMLFCNIWCKWAKNFKLWWVLASFVTELITVWASHLALTWIESVTLRTRRLTVQIGSNVIKLKVCEVL